MWAKNETHPSERPGMRQIRLPAVRIGALSRVVLGPPRARTLELRRDPVRHLALVPSLRRDLAQAREGFEEPLAHEPEANRTRAAPDSGFAADANVFCVRGLFDRRFLGRRRRRRLGRPLCRGADEVAEERLGARGARVELGVELRGDEERVVGQLDDLDQALVGRGAGERPGPRPRAGAGAGCSPHSGGGGACR